MDFRPLLPEIRWQSRLSPVSQSHEHKIFCNPFPPNRLTTKFPFPSTPFFTPLGVKSDQARRKAVLRTRQFRLAYCGENPQGETNLAGYL